MTKEQMIEKIAKGLHHQMHNGSGENCCLTCRSHAEHLFPTIKDMIIQWLVWVEIPHDGLWVRHLLFESLP